MLLKENQPLAPYTTFGIGGPARWFAEATTEEEIAEAADWARNQGAWNRGARNRGIDLFVLGGGSNVLVSDAGFNGLVLRIALRGIEAETSVPEPGHPQQPGSKIYRAAAGEDWDAFVARAVADNSAGVECLAGIPGTVGGTPVQNVGAYGQEAASVIESVRAFDLETCAFVEFTAAECGFAYRRSRFNSADRGRFVVTRVVYRLTPGGAPLLAYPDVQRAFERRRAEGGDPTLAEVAALVRAIRRSKGMLLVDNDPNCRSAGSFFKNPVVSEARFQQIAALSPTETPPHFAAGPGMVKVPAAWLIQQAGFAKGYARGAAAISSKHALALVNLGSDLGSDRSAPDTRGGATAGEILALAREISEAVEARFGIRLEREPVLVGF